MTESTDLILHRITRALEDISDCLQHHPEAHELLMRTLTIDTVPLQELARQWGCSMEVVKRLVRDDPTFPRPMEITRGRRVVFARDLRGWLVGRAPGLQELRRQVASEAGAS